MAGFAPSGFSPRHKAVTFLACIGILGIIAASLYVAAPVATGGKSWKNSAFKAESAGVPITVEKVFTLLQGVQDPEIELSVVELGLIYAVETTANRVALRMTLTTPSCGWSGQLLTDIRDKLFTHPAVAELDIKITYDPPWTLDRIDPVALKRLQNKVHIHVDPAAGASDTTAVR